jgi:hypothetical protein
MSEPERRYKADYDTLTRADPWRDPSVKITKDASGNVIAEPRSPDQPKPGEPPLSLQRTADGRVVLAEGMEPMTDSQLRELASFYAAENSRKLSIPKPNEYALQFAPDYVLPAGVEWKWNEGDPLLAQVREFASASGMSQDTFSRLLGLHAASRMAEIQEFNTARENQVKLLGDNANARVDAIRAWMKSLVPEHFNDLAPVLEMAPTASTVKAPEVLAHRWVTQSSGSYSGAHREPQIPGKISDEAYGKLTYGERLEYASKFSPPNR